MKYTPIKLEDNIDQRKFDFYNRLFLNRVYPTDTTPRIKKSLSGLSYRLAWLLSFNLDFDIPRKLPPRKVMAEKLSTTTAAIHESLAQLEMAGIIIRSTETSRMIFCDENQQREHNQHFDLYRKKQIETKSFKDNFCLNFFCNMPISEKIDYSINALLEVFLTPPHIYSFLNCDQDFKKIIFDKIIESQVLPSNYFDSDELTYQYISDLIDKYIKMNTYLNTLNMHQSQE